MARPRIVLRESLKSDDGLNGEVDGTFNHAMKCFLDLKVSRTTGDLRWLLANQLDVVDFNLRFVCTTSIIELLA